MKLLTMDEVHKRIRESGWKYLELTEDEFMQFLGIIPVQDYCKLNFFNISIGICPKFHRLPIFIKDIVGEENGRTNKEFR